MLRGEENSLCVSGTQGLRAEPGGSDWTCSLESVAGKPGMRYLGAWPAS